MKKRILLVISTFLLLIVFIVVGYVVYLSTGYYRIENATEYRLNEQVNNERVTLDTLYSISTYNIGFGAYDHDFSFFMDKGIMKNGTKVKGTGSVGKSKDTILKNTNGALNAIKQLETDFMFFQEVDVEATRSHKVNQFQMIKDQFQTHNSLFILNFHSRFLFYPIFNPHGSVESGLVTNANKYINKTVRYKLEIDESFPNKFFDLDRCFTVSYLPIKDSTKFLVLINVHLSAYDEGGVYRTKQWQQLNEIFKIETSRGNYVVCGGDFNHDISNDEDFLGFPSDQLKPEWVYTLSSEDISASQMRFATSYNAPTCRSTDMAYTRGSNYTVVVDGFLVSNNVKVVKIENVDLDFRYSDHNPVYMEFILM